MRSASAGRTPSSSAARFAFAAQKSNWASASSVSRSSVPLAPTSADSSSRMRPSSSSAAACASRQALPSSTTTSGSTNSVWPLPEASWTMPLTRLRASARTGTTYRPLRSVTIGSWSAPPSSEPTRLSSRRRSRSYATRTAARSGPRRGDAVSSSSPTGSKLRPSVPRSAGSGWSRRPRSRSSARRSSASDVARRAAASRVSMISRNCAGSSRPPRPARPIHGSMSCAAPIPTPGRSCSSALAWSVSSRLWATITGSSDGSRVSASRRDGSKEVFSASRARTAGNSSRAIERASIGVVRPGRRLVDG